MLKKREILCGCSSYVGTTPYCTPLNFILVHTYTTSIWYIQMENICSRKSACRWKIYASALKFSRCGGVVWRAAATNACCFATVRAITRAATTELAAVCFVFVWVCAIILKRGRERRVCYLIRENEEKLFLSFLHWFYEWRWGYIHSTYMLKYMLRLYYVSKRFLFIIMALR